MKKRIYKKWLKNPLNRRLLWKFCKPFGKVPVAEVKPIGWKTTINILEHISRMDQRIWEESMIPKVKFVLQGQTSLMTSSRLSEMAKQAEKAFNTNRNRYYGIRVGDIVQYSVPGTEPDGKQYEVASYGFMDNNRVCLEDKDGNIKEAVAEWCTIITKVEDRK